MNIKNIAATLALTTQAVNNEFTEGFAF